MLAKDIDGVGNEYAEFVLWFLEKRLRVQ